jgi:hypothetical protein
MRLVYWIRRHQLLATVVSFAVLTAPQWVASVWALFSSEPLVPWFFRHHIPRLAFSPWFITAPLGLLMFAIVIWIEWKVPFLSRAKLARLQELKAAAAPDSLMQPLSQSPAHDIIVELVPNRWASPALATVVNRDRDHPVHIKRATLFGISPDGRERRITESWKHKFPNCVVLPYSLPADREAQLAFAGHLPYESFNKLFVELEFENRNIVRSSEIPSPRPPASVDTHPYVPPTLATHGMAVVPPRGSQNDKPLRPIEIRDAIDDFIRKGQPLLDRWNTQNDAQTSAALSAQSLQWLTSVTEFVKRNLDISHVDKLADYAMTVKPNDRYKMAFNLEKAAIRPNNYPIAYELGYKLQILKYFRDEIH